MTDSQIDALVEAASTGVNFDELRVRGDDTFAFETPELSYVELSEAELREVAHQFPRYVSNWHYWERSVESRRSHRYAFLRWLEVADQPVPERYDALSTSIIRTWGQLALTVSLGTDGRRRYGVRHVADRETDVASLDAYDESTELRDFVRFTDDGAYRPLKTAPTLPPGWVLGDLDGDELCRAVEEVYPATVANWHRERNGELDVTHFEETAARQTGMYADIGKLDRDALERAVESCCADSECLKRRQWDATEDDELDAPRGDGEFPCREPCSLIVAASREFLTVEQEDESTHGLTLTESECEQLRALVTAVAEDRTVRDGDVSDPANRYRARYLRSKRFADEE